MANSELQQQFVLPNFQSALGIDKNTSRIPANHVDNLAETERVFSIQDVRRVIVELGISSEEKVDQTIIGWTRESGFIGNDTTIAIEHIIIGAAKDLSIGNRFEELYGVPLHIDTLFTHAFGGVLLDKDQAYLPRSAEDKRLDEERRDELTRKAEAAEESYIKECQRSEGN